MGRDYSLGKLIEILSHKIGEYETQILEQSELASLSGRQLFYLDEIFHLQNPNLTKLAEKMKVSKPSVTLIIDKLVKRGLVKRVRSQEDRRSYNLYLTAKGKKLAKLHDGIHDRFALMMESILSAVEKDELIKILGKVVEELF